MQIDVSGWVLAVRQAPMGGVFAMDAFYWSDLDRPTQDRAVALLARTGRTKYVDLDPGELTDLREPLRVSS